MVVVFIAATLLTSTTTTLTQLLTERLALWDQMDQAYEAGHVVRALELSGVVERELTPQIREAYGL